MASKFITALWIESDGRYAFGLQAEGAVKIELARYLELLKLQAEGQIIVRGEDGRPAAIDSPRPVVENLPGMIAARRYQAESVGINVRGISVATTRDSQSQIAGAALAASLDETYTCNWKTAETFVKLDAQMLLAIAAAVRYHVQACFDREAELLDTLKDGSFQLEMIDQGWPQ